MELNTLIIKGIPPFLNYVRAISGLGWEDIRTLKAGTIHRQITDNTQPGGSTTRKIAYTAPFLPANREQDYRRAWTHYEQLVTSD